MPECVCPLGARRLKLDEPPLLLAHPFNGESTGAQRVGELADAQHRYTAGGGQELT